MLMPLAVDAHLATRRAVSANRGAVSRDFITLSIDDAGTREHVRQARRLAAAVRMHGIASPHVTRLYSTTRQSPTLAAIVPTEQYRRGG